MVCIDGWGDLDYNQFGYRTKHSSAWTHDYAWWSAELQKKSMTLGIYDNPLWVNVNAANAGLKVKGTNILISSLLNLNENALWFKWLQVERPGAEEYVKGYVQHYADMGVKFLRVDFLSWFESGYDRNVGMVGPDRRNSNINGLSYYATALKWMREACDANGMFLSLVMPNLYTDAVLEQKYGHMLRINEDCAEGGWYRFSDSSRGVKRAGWSQFANPFDGYVYWSKIAGRGKMILDGDFIRLNTYANDEERKSVVSLHLMAGGPVSIADQNNTIGSNSWIYQNEELLALNQDGFVGAPLSNDPTNALNQVWKGQLTNGDWIVGFFNREGSAQTRSINFQNDLGISGNVFVRDLWSHTDIGSVSSLSRSVPAHGCMIFRIKANSNKVISPLFSIKEGSYKTSCSVGLSTTTAGATIYYTVDGSVPTASSSLYIAPIPVSTTSTIKAVAIKNGMEDSYVNKAIYMIGEAKPQATINIGATFNNWTLSATPLKNTGGNNWTTDPITIPVGDQVMKFANTTNWSGDDWGNAFGLNGTTQLTTGGGAFVSFTTPVAGKYLITFNDYTLAYNVKKTLDFVQSQNVCCRLFQ
ncbi:MAG: chitobiase/beta-hexosaminidase C-terminal domain-containing protein [Paludibacter sp.]